MLNKNQIQSLRGERGNQGPTIGVIPKYQMSADGETWHDTVPNPTAIRVSYDNGRTFSYAFKNLYPVRPDEPIKLEEGQYPLHISDSTIKSTGNSVSVEDVIARIDDALSSKLLP